MISGVPIAVYWRVAGNRYCQAGSRRALGISSECVRQGYPAVAGVQVGVVSPADVCHLASQLGLEGAGEHGYAVAAALAAPDHDLAAVEGTGP